MEKFYLTTPLYYANARPHIGSAYSTLVCDTIARFKQMCGYQVAYLTGTDEYGENLQRAADRLGITPKELVDQNAQIFQHVWKALGIQYTHFIRTTHAEHVRAVHKLIRRAQAGGYIYRGRYRGRYCVHDNLYVSDSAEPADCPTCGRPAELKDEENYFFRLSAFQERLLEHYEKNPEFVRPEFRLNEVRSFVKAGLRDISVSRRTLKWGVPWPDDPEHVVYVWYDALTGYLTGIGFAEGENGSPGFWRLWPADLHMMAKEIIRFHAVYWPAFLMAANLPLPKTIFAHGWLLFEQDKMSKSKGNVLYCEPIVEVLGSDALRYYLLRDMAFGQDSNFTIDGLVQRFNSDLANDLGNLASRTLTMINRYFGGVIPEASPPIDVGTEYRFLAVGETDRNTFVRHFYNYEFSRGLEAIWHLIATTNEYLTSQQPWALAEEPARRDDLANVLYTAAEALRFVAVLAHPALPISTQKLWEQLGQRGHVGNFLLDSLKWGELRPGTKVGKPEPLFPRLDKEATIKRLVELEDVERVRAATGKETAALVGTQPSARPKAEESKISIEDFAKIDLRVGEIVQAEPVSGTQKLLKLNVDIGTEVRQVVAGIAEQYAPEQLVGMKVVLVANLQPRKVRGVESNGMILAAVVGAEGRPVLVTFKEDVPNGARLE